MVTVQISAVHVHLSEQARAYITEKLSHLDRFHPRLAQLHVTIHQADKVGYKVDVDLHLPTGKDVVAHDTEETLHAAIDIVAGKCAAQLRKIHGKEAEVHRRSA